MGKLLNSLNLKQSTIMAFLVLSLSGCQTKKFDYSKIKVFSPVEVKKDADYLKFALDKIDVSAWERISKKEFNENLKTTIEKDFWLQSRLDIFRNLAPLVASLGETHSRLIYPEKLSKTDRLYHATFPILVLCEKKGVFVARDMRTTNVHRIPVGARITAINEFPINEIINNMSQFVARETDSGQRRLMQVNFEQLLVRELGLKPPFKVDWELDSEVNSNLVTAVPRSQVSNKKLSSKKPKDFFSVRYLDDTTALIWISDFESPPELFKDYLDRLFQELNKKSVDKLVIDLRYNSGGISENVLSLLSYLENNPIRWANRITLKNSREFRQLNNRKVKQIKKEKLGSNLKWLPLEYLNGWNWKVLFGSEGGNIEQQVTPEPVEPEQNRYRGALAVISNGHCFSACAFFVDYIQKSKRGIVVGEEAGSLVGIQLGYPVLITLPISGLQLMVPVAKIQSSAKAHQVQPDIEISRRQSDIAHGRDPELAGAVSSLIALTRE